jgi:hypothetical protein
MSNKAAPKNAQTGSVHRSTGSTSLGAKSKSDALKTVLQQVNEAATKFSRAVSSGTAAADRHSAKG